jgi:hypothetical protein
VLPNHPLGPRPLGLFALIALALVAGPVFADVQMPPSIKIEAGEADLKAPGENQPWRKARPGQVVDFGLVVSTNRAFSGSIVYADGTRLVMKPSTMLQVLSDGLRLYRGQTWIKVTKRGKSFTAVTPSAIASVRGTQFSCEVPSMSRVFARRYVREFFERAHLNRGLRGNLLSGSIGFAVLAGMLGEAPGGRLPVAVKVFEGRVMVAYPANTGSIKATWMVTPGEKIDVTAGENAKKTQLASADFANWSLPVPAGLAADAAATPGLPMGPAEDLPGLVGRGHAEPTRTLKLLEEGHTQH